MVSLVCYACSFGIHRRVIPDLGSIHNLWEFNNATYQILKEANVWMRESLVA
jgi:hypothetical protein